MNSTIQTALDKILLSVMRPAFYTGGEKIGHLPDFAPKRNRFCFCFPDGYDVGMSNIALKIITGLVNTQPRWSAERAFLPFPDMLAAMRENGIPLYALETYDPLAKFDIIGFTLQYELCYTNVLAMLELAGIPVLAKDRKDGDYPVIIGGGPCAVNPEPLAEFFDIFVVGEGEEIIPELLALYNKDKSNFIENAYNIQGVYVPSLPPKPVNKRFVRDLDTMYFPDTFVTPLTEIVQDRAVAEVLRGCVRGCRFCQAGFASRPYREKSPDTILNQAKNICESTGYDELSLTSLSTSDHTRVDELLLKLSDYTDENKISLSLPSMRIDKFSPQIAARLKKKRKSGLTFAPEAGSQRLRDVINKNITEEEILHGCGVAFGEGYTDVKLYFMLGLPTETDEDIVAIHTLAKKILDEYYHTPNRTRGKQPSVSISVSTFIPKPFTPFQFEPFVDRETVENRQKILLDLCRNDRKIKVSYSDYNMSRLEATFARGGRELYAVILAAYKGGAMFDAWSEHFHPEIWDKAFADTGIDSRQISEYNYKVDLNEIYTKTLPWDFINIGVSRAFLISENRKAHETQTTQNCFEQCSACSAEYSPYCNSQKKLRQEHQQKNQQQQPNNTPVGTQIDTSDTTKTDTPDITPTTYTHVRVFFEKTGRAKYISHLDLYRLIMRALKAANIPVWETAGFNKRMYVMFDLPLPLGVSGLRESFEVKLPVEFVENHLNGLRLLDRVLPDGIRILSASTPVIKHTEIAYAKYVIRGSFPQFDLFLSQPKIPVTKHTKKNDTVLDLKPLIKNPTITDTELTVLLPSGQSFSVGANLLIDAYNKFAENAATITDITRVALYTEDGREFI